MVSSRKKSPKSLLYISDCGQIQAILVHLSIIKDFGRANVSFALSFVSSFAPSFKSFWGFGAIYSFFVME